MLSELRVKQRSWRATCSKVEITYTKGAELFAEAISGTIVQMAALVISGSETSSNPAFNFACCVFTAAFTSSTMSYDWDTGKAQQKYSPSFYGYVPENAKGEVLGFLSLYFLSAFNLLARALTCVLLQLRGGMTLVAQVLGVELALFFVVKGLMRDLWYLVPLYGVGGGVISFLIRLITKVLGNWTGLVQMQHPQEIGGFYFVVSLLVSITIGIVAS